MNFVDTHAHIYLDDFKDDLDRVIETAKSKGISTILMPAIDNSTHTSMLQTEQAFPGSCRCMMGLHPCSVKDDYQTELAEVQYHLSRRKFVAIGEIGLDFYWDISFKSQQYDAFQRQITLALDFNIPIVIHSRNAVDECIKVVQDNQEGDLKGVFHCFTGTIDQARKIIELGFYLGIGGVLTYKNSGLDKVMGEIGLEKVILETDAPYLTPVPNRGKRNEPTYIPIIAEKLAEIKKITVNEIASITTQNAQKLFGL
jgi:TatD DNase family protein